MSCHGENSRQRGRGRSWVWAGRRPEVERSRTGHPREESGRGPWSVLRGRCLRAPMGRWAKARGRAAEREPDEMENSPLTGLARRRGQASPWSRGKPPRADGRRPGAPGQDWGGPSCAPGCKRSGLQGSMDPHPARRDSPRPPAPNQRSQALQQAGKRGPPTAAPEPPHTLARADEHRPYFMVAKLRHGR